MAENIDILIEAFGRKYAPAESIHESTEQITTDEIMMMFGASDLTTPEMITEALNKSGFKLEVYDLKFVWLVKEKAG